MSRFIWNSLTVSALLLNRLLQLALLADLLREFRYGFPGLSSAKQFLRLTLRHLILQELLLFELAYNLNAHLSLVFEASLHEDGFEIYSTWEMSRHSSCK